MMADLSSRKSTRRRHVRGMSLVEVLVAVVVFAVGVLGLVNSHALAFNTFADSKYRIDAALLADRLIGELWVDRANVASYAHTGGTTSFGRLSPWLAELRQTLPGADATVAVVGTVVTVTVSWQTPSNERHRHVAVTTLQEP